ncbi:MAG: hypothetical protein INF43_02000 [Alphaproteobacteria bacterium]|jgi:hypothetical protein|nr:hypothetical protein [Alphaproteobacteria bacterium]
MFLPSLDAITREDRRLRLAEPDIRVRIAVGKRNRKWRDGRKRQCKPEGKPRSARLN